MKRFQLSTLMLLIVIACMAAALVVQHQRAARREADLRAAFAQNRQFLARQQQLFAEKQEMLRDLNRANAEAKKHLENSKKLADMMAGPTKPTVMWIDGWPIYGMSRSKNGESGWKKEFRDELIRSWKQAYTAYLDEHSPSESPSTEAKQKTARELRSRVASDLRHLPTGLLEILQATD
jgi:hypothetical protein